MSGNVHLAGARDGAAPCRHERAGHDRHGPRPWSSSTSRTTSPILTAACTCVTAQQRSTWRTPRSRRPGLPVACRLHAGLASAGHAPFRQGRRQLARPLRPRHLGRRAAPRSGGRRRAGRKGSGGEDGYSGFTVADPRRAPPTPTGGRAAAGPRHRDRGHRGSDHRLLRQGDRARRRRWGTTATVITDGVRPSTSSRRRRPTGPRRDGGRRV